MKVLKRFIDGEKEYQFIDHVFSEFDQLTSNVDVVVKFKGEVWEWQTYDRLSNGVADVEAIYSKMHDSKLMLPTSVVGPEKPFPVKCVCGSAACNHPGHSHFCDVLHKDGWDEAIEEWKRNQRLEIYDSSYSYY